MEREEEARAGGRVRAPAAAFVDGFGILLGIFFFLFNFQNQKKRKKKNKWVRWSLEILLIKSAVISSDLAVRAGQPVHPAIVFALLRHLTLPYGAC